MRAPETTLDDIEDDRDGGRRHEVFGLLALAATSLMGLSLFSYDQRGGEDWIGPVGAWFAGLFATAFGVAAFVVPVELALLSFRLFRRSLGTRMLSPLGVARFMSTVIVVLVGCAMVHLALPEETVMGGHLPGGAFGEVIGEVLRSLLGLVGAFVVGFTILLVTMVLRTSLSVVEMSRTVAKTALAGGEKARALGSSVAQAFRDAKQLEDEEREALRKKNEPRIVTAAGDVRAEDVSRSESTPDVKRREATLGDDAAKLVDETKKKRGRAVAEVPVEREVAEPSVPVETKTKGRGKKAKAELEASIAEVSEPRSAKHDAKHEAPDAAAERDTLDDEPELDAEDEIVAPPRAAKTKSTPPSGPTIVAPRVEPVRVEPPPPVEEAPTRRSRAYIVPPTTLLDAPLVQALDIDEKHLRENAEKLVEKLAAYGVRGRVDEIHPGPVVTMYEFEPESGTKVSKIAGLADDLAMALAAQKVRIVAPIPGKARVGFELPNKKRQMVALREILEDARWDDNRGALPVAFGKDIAGQPVYGDLAKMPHLLVAGATGAGKSVGLNVMLASLLMRRTPEEVRMLMIDPKVVELAVFDGIPHMLLPVVTDMKKASLALRWAVDEMERRYQLFADAGARNITTYNERVERVISGEMPVEKLFPKKAGKQLALGIDGEEVLMDPVDDERADALPIPPKLPYIVVVVDEFADLMMVAAKDVEAAIARLAQKARAAGIHVILATQRPSVDVITGMIKANFPARIAFKVSQREDSKTILGRIGAEHLLGHGDMLMIPPGSSDLKRVHSAYIGETEVQALCDHLREQGAPVYDERIVAPRDDEEGEDGEGGGGGGRESDDPQYDKAVAAVAAAGYCSISHLQRQLGVGYNKAAKLVERMEKEGIVGPASGKAGGRREVLISAL